MIELIECIEDGKKKNRGYKKSEEINTFNYHKNIDFVVYNYVTYMYYD